MTSMATPTEGAVMEETLGDEIRRRQTYVLKAAVARRMAERADNLQRQLAEAQDTIERRDGMIRNRDSQLAEIRKALLSAIRKSLIRYIGQGYDRQDVGMFLPLVPPDIVDEAWAEPFLEKLRTPSR